MSQLEKQTNISKVLGRKPHSSSIDVKIIEVSCDGDCVSMSVQGHENFAQIRQKALSELRILTPHPNKYLLFDSNGQRVADGRSVDEFLSQDQILNFRLIPQTQFGSMNHE